MSPPACRTGCTNPAERIGLSTLRLASLRPKASRCKQAPNQNKHARWQIKSQTPLVCVPKICWVQASVAEEVRAEQEKAHIQQLRWPLTSAPRGCHLQDHRI